MSEEEMDAELDKIEAEDADESKEGKENGPEATKPSDKPE